MSKYYIITYSANYADEFDIEKIWACSEEQKVDLFSEIAQQFYEGENEFYFGTNEFMEYSSLEEALEDFDVSEVDVSTFNVMKDLLGNYGIGTAPFLKNPVA